MKKALRPLSSTRITYYQIEFALERAAAYMALASRAISDLDLGSARDWDAFSSMPALLSINDCLCYSEAVDGKLRVILEARRNSAQPRDRAADPTLEVAA